MIDLQNAFCFGGWPQNLGQSEGGALLSVADYADETIRVDIPTASGVRHDPTMVQRLLVSLAHNVATEVKLNTNPATIDKAAKTLLRLKDKTTRQRAANLTALLVITPTGPAYRRPDGVQIAPITALAP